MSQPFGDPTPHEGQPSYPPQAYAPSGQPQGQPQGQPPQTYGGQPGQLTPGYGAPPPSGQIGIHREPWVQWLMLLIPIYGIVHVCSVPEQLKRYDHRVGGSGVATFFAFFPGAYLLLIPPIIVTVRTAERIRQAQHAAGLQPTCSTAKSVLGLFLFNTVYWHWQGEMNKIWDRYPGAPTGTLVPLNA